MEKINFDVIEKILLFFGKLGINDIQSYLNLDIEEVKKIISNMPFEYTFDNFYFVCDSKNEILDIEILDFINYLLVNDRLTYSHAEKIQSINNWCIKFTLEQTLLILYISEKYKDIIKLCTQNKISNEYYIRSLANIGMYSSDDAIMLIDDLMSFVRFLWQKGLMETAKKTCDIIDETLDSVDNLLSVGIYLNDKIRIYRDIYEKESTNAIYKELDAILEITSQRNMVVFSKLFSKKQYNKAIDFFIDCKFKKSIRFIDSSIEYRTGKHDIPYLELRKIRCKILSSTDIINIKAELDEINISKDDFWVQGLMNSVLAEYYLYCEQDIETSIKYACDALNIELATDAHIKYSNIFLIYLYIIKNNKEQVLSIMSELREYEIVSAKIALIIAEAYLSILKNRVIDVWVLQDKLEKYSSKIYKFHGIYALNCFIMIYGNITIKNSYKLQTSCSDLKSNLKDFMTIPMPK